MKRETTALRIMLFLYILFCLILAGLNQGPDKELARAVAPYWHAYENEGKTLLILVCDVIGRVIARPGEAQVSVVLALIGGPVLMLMVRRRKLPTV